MNKPSITPTGETLDIHVGSGQFQYQVQPGWGELPSGWELVEVAGVATDRAGRVFVFNRGEHPIVVFDRAGRFLGSWGEGLFKRPHGLTIGPDDALYCTDDLDHTVRKFSPQGQLLFTLGASGQPSDTGANTIDYRTILRAAGPFNFPTNLAIAPSGELYIADGYGNARVHRYSAQGDWIQSWGGPGDAAGQFHLPHGIAVAADGRVAVADRENSRIQWFSPTGEFLEQWTEIARPCQVRIDSAGYVFVAELGYRAGLFPGNPVPTGGTGGRLSVFDSRGRLQARWGGGDNPCAPGDFFAPHDVALDPHGDLYVGEVTYSAGGNRGVVPRSCHTLQKFVRHSNQDAA